MRKSIFPHFEEEKRNFTCIFSSFEKISPHPLPLPHRPKKIFPLLFLIPLRRGRGEE